MGKASKTVRIENVREKDSVRFGRTIPGRIAEGHHLEVTVGQSVRLFGTETNRYVKNAEGAYVPGVINYDLTFKVGDRAVYDSYNLVYTGTIVAIGEKTITIQPEHSERARRLEWHEFSWRNRDYDAAKIADRNHDVFMTC